ncbi:MAG: hypothetical protein KAU26_05115 [Methylococcales bacterium]|nr:hypothetical protein [Methylococcales bacterium]
MKNSKLLLVLASLFMMNIAVAEHAEDESGAKYLAKSQELILQNVHFVNADGNESKITYNVKLKLTGDAPLQFTTVGQACEAPKTWHAPMDHCMDQRPK